MRTLSIDGTTYTLPAPTDGALQQRLLALIKQADADPLRDTIAMCKDLSPEVQTALLKDALALKYRSVPTREERQQKLEAYVGTPAGLEAFLVLLWQRHQPALTVDQIWALHGRAVQLHGEGYFEESKG